MSTDTPSGRRYSDDDLLDPIREFADEHGRPPKLTEYGEIATAHPKTACRRFGSWSAAVAAAGHDPDDIPHGNRDRVSEYTDEECLEWIDSFVEFFGVVPSAHDLNGWPGPSEYVYLKRFGGVREAVREAGYEPRGYQ